MDYYINSIGHHSNGASDAIWEDEWWDELDLIDEFWETLYAKALEVAGVECDDEYEEGCVVESFNFTVVTDDADVLIGFNATSLLPFVYPFFIPIN